MNSAARKIDQHQSTKPAALEVFRERCAARASLVAHNMMDLQDAVDGLQLAAERTGLVDELGQDGVQEIMAEAFKVEALMVNQLTAPIAKITELERLAILRQCQEFQKIPPRISAPIDESRAAARERHRTAASTIDAFWYVVGLCDQAHCKAWLADHPQDAPFLLKLLEGK